jgi:hypothetical protein
MVQRQLCSTFIHYPRFLSIQASWYCHCFVRFYQCVLSSALIQKFFFFFLSWYHIWSLTLVFYYDCKNCSWLEICVYDTQIIYVIEIFCWLIHWQFSDTVNCVLSIYSFVSPFSKWTVITMVQFLLVTMSRLFRAYPVSNPLGAWVLSLVVMWLEHELITLVIEIQCLQSWLDNQVFKSWMGLGIFLLTTMSRPALEPT